MVSVLPLREPLVDRVEYSVEVGRLPLIPHQDPLDGLGEDDAGLRSRRCGNYSSVPGKNLIDFADLLSFFKPGFVERLSRPVHSF